MIGEEIVEPYRVFFVDQLFSPVTLCPTLLTLSPDLEEVNRTDTRRMSKVCVDCTGRLTAKSPGLQCGFCDRYFHSKCVGISSSTLKIYQSEGTYWKCKSCRSSSPNNKSIVITSDGDDGESALDVPSNTETSLDTIIILNEIRADIRAMSARYDELLKSVTFCSDKVSDFERGLNKLNEKTKIVDRLVSENNELKKEVSSLTARLDDADQYSRLNNLEICGVPEQSNENILSIVTSISEHIGCPIALSDVDVAHRVASFGSSRDRSRNIIVRFGLRRKKEELLAAVKTFRRGSVAEGASGISVPTISNNIYVNEHLTVSNKNLLKTVKHAAREKNYKYVWVRNAVIYARRDDRSKAIIIRNDTEISKL